MKTITKHKVKVRQEINIVFRKKMKRNTERYSFLRKKNAKN